MLWSCQDCKCCKSSQNWNHDQTTNASEPFSDSILNDYCAGNGERLLHHKLSAFLALTLYQNQCNCNFLSCSVNLTPAPRSKLLTDRVLDSREQIMNCQSSVTSNILGCFVSETRNPAISPMKSVAESCRLPFLFCLDRTTEKFGPIQVYELPSFDLVLLAGSKRNRMEREWPWLEVHMRHVLAFFCWPPKLWHQHCHVDIRYSKS